MSEKDTKQQSLVILGNGLLGASSIYFTCILTQIIIIQFD